MVIVEARDRNVRMRFNELEMPQRDAVTRMIFAGADLWLTGLEAKTFDRPGQSFFRILRVSLRGMMLIPAAMFARHEQAPPPPPPPRPRRTRTRPASHTIVSLLLAAAFGLGLSAASSYAAEPPAPQGFEEVRDFRLLGERQPLVLRGTDVQAALNFSLPLAKVATEARLGLNYQLSPLLDASKTELQVVLNGSYIGSIPLERGVAGADAFSHAELAVPAELLLAQNTLAFQLKGQCAGACPGGDGEIRTVIDLSSSLRMSGEVIPWPNELSLLPAPFFDPNLQQAVELAFVLPVDADVQVLKAAGLVASYFGALADHRGLRFPVSRSGFPKGNAVVFALESSDLTALKMDPPAGPVVALRDNPSDTSGKLLVLGGRNSSQLLQAADAFARGLTLKKGDVFQVAGLPAVPARRPYDAPRWLRTGQLTPVGGSMPDDQLRVEGNGIVRWYFRLPPDLYFGEREGVPLRLHYRYAPLPSTSRAEVRITINGVEVAVRRFSGGSQVESIRDTVELPVAALYPRNTLTLEFKSIDGSGRKSAPVGSLLRDSQLDLRNVPHFATLPRLDLFAKAGFPFTRMADLSETAVVLPDHPSPEELRAYLELMGFFAAQTGTPGLQIDVLDPQRALRSGDKDLLLIGTPQTMPLYSTWASQMPLTMDKSGLTLNRPDSIYLRLLAFPVTREGRESRRLADRLSAEAVPGIVLQAFLSPLNAQRSVVAISAVTPAAFEQLADALNRSIQNEEVFGSVSLQTARGFESYRLPAPSYNLGSLDWFAATNYWIYRYKWFVPLIVLLIGLFLANVTSGWVERHAEERLRIES